MNSRKSVFIAACVMASTIVFTSAQAFAAGHSFSKSLPAPTGGFKNPWGVAVGTGGELFVSNGGSNVVDVYSSSGTFEKEFEVGTPGDELRQVAVDNSSEISDTSKGDLYIADVEAGKFYRYKYESGTPTEEGSISVSNPRAVAVDSSGNVYVAYFQETPSEEPGFAVNKYGPKGELIKEKLFEGEGDARSMAIDSSGDVYLAGQEGVVAYSGETGACLNSCAKVGLTRRAGGVAVGPEGNIFETIGIESEQTAEREVKVFEPNGTEVESFDSTHLVKDARGIAFNGTTVYVADTEDNEVAEFTAGPSKAKLKVEKSGTGEGTVKSNPSGIDCGPACPEETAEFTESEKVTLTETPETGSTFTGWTGCEVEPGPTECEVTATGAKTVIAKFTSEAAFPLTVILTGKGKVTSSPAGITCSIAECTEEFAGKVTLTEEAASGYEFAGWIGCKHVTETTCTVDVTAATEVVAVFLKEGPPGPKGETGGEGPPGTNGKNGTNGTNGKEGPQGPAGAQGEKGANGANGANGAAGPQGPAGAQGPAGPAGQVELVTCTKKGKKQHCTTKLVSGTVKFTTTGRSAKATLSRHGAVFAAGMARVAHRRLSLRLTPLRRLRPGRYTLTLIGGTGRHETIRTESFTLG